MKNAPMDSSSRPIQHVKKYTVRPLSKPARTDYKDAFRIYLAPAALLQHQLRAGDACYIWIEGSPQHTAIAWTATGEIRDTVVQTSKALQIIYGFKLGDKVSISKRQDQIITADVVFLRDVGPQTNPDGSIPARENSNLEDIAGWEWFLEYPLEKAEYVVPGMVFDYMECKGQKRSFQVEKISGSTIVTASEENNSSLFFFFAKGSHVKLISDLDAIIESPAIGIKRLQIHPEAVGGLAPQIRSLNELFKAFDIGSYRIPRRLGGPGGILLYGPPGTGKSLLLNEVACTGWGRVFNLDTSVVGKFLGESEAAVRKVFSEAKKHQPSIVIIDELDSFAPKRGRQSDGSEPKIVATLLAEFNELSKVTEEGNSSRVLVIAATSRPNDIDESLRRPGRFESEIEIPIPNASARTEILKVLLDLPIDAQDKLLDGLGERTHGFVGADLQGVLKKAVIKAISRSQASQLLSDMPDAVLNFNGAGMVAEHDQIFLAERKFNLSQDDINAALLEVRPSAMREVYLEPPKVRWIDIGGQDEAKQSLREAVEWPLKHPEIMKELGITATKGLLLYGPPGCSKTLTAQALATEAGLNFIAVKGAELLNMYVGESERAIREVFRKARAASPSIIFFDEIDAIGSTRESGPSNGLNVLTTLLNELDGIEILKGVTILAATNKPEALDPALMRPGRLDTMLYVGPPDLAARKEILKIKVRKMKISSEVDIEELAEILDGHSGAEIVSICDKAGHATMKDCLVDGKIKPITREHFQFAISKVERQITDAVRMKYEQWSIGGAKRL